MRSTFLGAAFLAALATPAWADWPGNPSANLPVCTAIQEQANATVCSDGAGGAYIAWDDRRNDLTDDPDNPIPDIYLQHVLTTGAVDPAWPPDGLGLSEGTGPRFGPRVVEDGAGGAIVVWDRSDAAGIATYAQHVRADATFDPAWEAGGVALAGVNVRVISDQAGGILSVWSEYSDGSFDVRAQRLRAEGTLDPSWPALGAVLATGSLYDTEPTLTSDGGSGAIVAWSQSFHVMALHVQADGVPDPAWDGGRTLSDSYAWCPTPVGDGAGGVIVAWFDAGSDAQYDVVAHHVLPSGEIDPEWPQNGRRLTRAAGSQAYPSIVSDMQGGAIVAWDDRRASGSDLQWYADVYAAHVLHDGTLDPQWPEDGLPVCAADNPQWRVAMVSDGSGGALLAWDDFRNGNDDVYAQHVLPAIGIDDRWPVNGAAVSLASGHQEFPGQGAQTYLLAATSDSAGGSILAWTDYRAGSATDIYTQRIKNDGSLAPPTASAPSAVAPALLTLAAINPAFGRPVIRWSLTRSAPARLDVFDVSGRSLESRALPAGAMSGSATLQHLPAGVYMIRIAQRERSVSCRVVVLE